MNEITRFDLDMDGSMEPSEHGLWVLYEDAQRQWVGLTEQEALDCFSPNPVTHSKNVEAKLKELNT